MTSTTCCRLCLNRSGASIRRSKIHASVCRFER
jgi:hypothetical protein